MGIRQQLRRTALVSSVVAALVVSTGLPAAAAAPGGDAVPIVQPGRKLVSTKLIGSLAQPRAGARTVFVQLTGQGAADAATRAIATGGRAAGVTASRARRSAVRTDASQVVAAARGTDPRARQLFQVSNAVPGVAITANSAALKALAARTDVVKISEIVSKTVSNAGAAQLVKALDTWQRTGRTGKGVTVGVIDTGIDYTHADFGGAGTVAAYDAAKAASTGAFTPTAKVAGGYDFVGDDYDSDPTSPDYQPVPRPDPNPLDCEGHGTHVSGTVGGYGVAADGTAFRGNYASLTSQQLYDMKIGPGMAPGVSLYGLRVFGCAGSTDVVIPALDRALDPNGDGDFSDHLDIVNLSLGSDDSPADDPENAVVDAIAAHGVLPVIAAGNNGDLTDTAGSPGNAVRALTAASSVDAYQLRDGLRVEAPDPVKGVEPVQFSTAYDWAGKPAVTADVVALSAADADGCDPLGAEDAAKVAGKAAWLIWDDDDATRRCGSAARAANVANAGGTGAVFTSSREVFGAGITGVATIPVVQLPKTGTDRLAPAVAAGTLRVTFDGTLRGTIQSVTPAIEDTLSSFSSRGTHGSAPGIVKPDVAAPGDTLASASVGTGNGVEVESGTSMATPVTAGIAALVDEVHPAWTTEQTKAAVMNTAVHDVFTGNGRTGLRYGPARVGSGRVDALGAVSTSVLVYDAARDGAVSASFGVVEVPPTGTVQKRRTLVVQNTGSRTAAVKLAYSAAIAQPGVSYSVRPATVSVKANRSAQVVVTMTVKGGSLRRTIDGTMTRTQTDPYLGVDRARQYVSDASGRLVASVGTQRLRVPVYGAAKPVSRTTVAAKGATLRVTGRGVSQGSGAAAYASKLSVLDLTYSSPKQPACTAATAIGCASTPTARSADLQYVGASSTPSSGGGAADGRLWFGVSTWGDWAKLGGAVVPYVDIDVDGDGAFDYEAYVTSESGTDLLTSFLVDLKTGDLVDVEPANFADGDVDTNPFDTDTILIPVLPSAIGVTDGATTFPIRYQVGTSSIYAPAASQGVQDSTPVLSYDAVNPAVQVGSPLYLDRSGARIPVQVDGASAKALILHLGAASGKKAQVLTLKRTGSKS